MKKTLVSALLLAFTAPLSAAPAKLVISADKPEGVYTSADKQIVFRVNPAPADGEKIMFSTKIDVAPAEVKELGKDGIITVPAKQGWTQVRAWRVNEKGKTIGQIAYKGVLTDIDKIQPGAPCPKDFKQFWDNEIARQNQEPLNPVLEKVEVKDPSVAAWKFTLNCADGDIATGYIAKPAKAAPASLPAIVQFHGASTFFLNGPGTYYAKHGIHVVMCPHPTKGAPDAEYRKMMIKKLDGYTKRNADDREKYYMKQMILRVVRTLQFVESQPEWNQKVLVTHGESQGGFQSIVGAALDPHVTFCLAMVPAMSDHLGYRQGHVNGWPYVLKMNPEYTAPADDFSKKADDILPYFDNANFARLIHCPVWISTGTQDSTCPPSGVCAVFNSLPADNPDKHFFVNPNAGHDAGYAGVVETLHKLVPPPED